MSKVKTMTFRFDKTTDSCIRIFAKRGEQPLFGSLYVTQDMWPQGAVAIEFEPRFIFERERGKEV